MDLMDILGIEQVLAGGIFVAIEMSLGFISMILNVIILATIKHSELLQNDEKYLLMGNMSAANIIICSFVKLMSVVLCGHAVAINSLEADFQFCSIFVFFHRMTWSILPSSIFFYYWLDLVPRIRLYMINTHIVSDQDASSMGKISSSEDEGVLTKRHMIRKADYYVALLKVTHFKI